MRQFRKLSYQHFGILVIPKPARGGNLMDEKPCLQEQLRKAAGREVEVRYAWINGAESIR